MIYFTRRELIDAIIEHEENGYVPGEDMPAPVQRKQLEKLNNDKLISYYENLTTNYGHYEMVQP